MTETTSADANDEVVTSDGIETTTMSEASETEKDLSQLDTPGDVDNDTSGNREAARYRKRLREVEAEHGRTRDVLAAMQRAEVERLADLEKPAALWASGVELAELLDDDGAVDADKVHVAAQSAREAFGTPAASPPAFQANPGQGRYGAGPSEPEDAWEGAFRGSR